MDLTLKLPSETCDDLDYEYAISDFCGSIHLLFSFGEITLPSTIHMGQFYEQHIFVMHTDNHFKSINDYLYAIIQNNYTILAISYQEDEYYIVSFNLLWDMIFNRYGKLNHKDYFIQEKQAYACDTYGQMLHEHGMTESLHNLFKTDPYNNDYYKYYHDGIIDCIEEI